MGSGTEGTDEGPVTPSRGRVPTREELVRRFTYQKPRDAQAVKNHKTVSTLTLALAIDLCKVCPPGRNLSLALTALEEVRMRANAAIAVDDPRP